MQRSLSNEGSGSDVTSSSASSRNQKSSTYATAKTMASPANYHQGDSAFSTPTQPQSERKDKQRATDLPPPNSVPTRALRNSQSYTSPLSPSMLSSSSYKSINLNSGMSSGDEPARIITYTKHSQGFTWNDELFLPSYLVGRHYRGSKARRRWGYDEDEDMDDDNDMPFDEETDRCPVADIFVTDEETAAMLP